MISFIAYIADMIAHLNIVIDNADLYYEDDDGIIRKTSSSPGYAFAYKDIENMRQAAIKCIDSIYDRNKPK